MIGKLIAKLSCLQGVRLHYGARDEITTRIEEECGFELPSEHKVALQATNGVEAYDGYVRLFGLCTTERSAQDPYDDMIKLVHEKFGSLGSPPSPAISRMLIATPEGGCFASTIV